MGTRLAGALAAAHALKVLHRDIKPHNILVDGRGEPHVTDFGLARLIGDSGMTSHGMFVGTLDYASPEQAEMRELDERSDLYSLGVILFEMATGRRPLTGRSSPDVLRLHIYEGPPDPRSLRSGIPPALSAVILRCLEQEPRRRFQSARALRQGLESVSRA